MLDAVEPFGQEPFLAEIGVAAFAEFVIARLDNGERTGWKAIALDYRWSGYEFDLTLESRRRQGETLAGAGTDDAAWRAACEHVREWARENHPFSDLDLHALNVGSALLADEPQDLDALYLARTATASKIYAALYPDRWVIYDSRLALRLAALVRSWWTTIGAKTASPFLRFPIPSGRANFEKPAGFPSLSTHGSQRQARLAFV